MKRIPILIASMLLLAACEKQIDLDIEYTEPQVVVMSQNDADDPVSLTLTYSRPIYGTYYVRNGEDYFQQITNATATLSVNGGNAITATRNGNRYSFPYTPAAGDNLSLQISVPGKDKVTATATVPTAPSVANVTFSHPDTSMIYSNYYENSTVNLTLTDNASSTDYYSIRVRCIDTCYAVIRNYYDSITGYDTVYNDRYLEFECIDNILIQNSDLGSMVELDPTGAMRYYGDELLFTDANINGQQHTIKLSPYSYVEYYPEIGDYSFYGEMTEYSARLIVEVSALTRDQYLFRQTMQSYTYDDMIGLFSEPVQVHSNINGGIGIFGVCVKQSTTFYLHD